MPRCGLLKPLCVAQNAFVVELAKVLQRLGSGVVSFDPSRLFFFTTKSGSWKTTLKLTPAQTLSKYATVTGVILLPRAREQNPRKSRDRHCRLHGFSKTIHIFKLLVLLLGDCGFRLHPLRLYRQSRSHQGVDDLLLLSKSVAVRGADCTLSRGPKLNRKACPSSFGPRLALLHLCLGPLYCLTPKIGKKY